MASVAPVPVTFSVSVFDDISSQSFVLFLMATERGFVDLLEFRWRKETAIVPGSERLGQEVNVDSCRRGHQARTETCRILRHPFLGHRFRQG